MHRIISVLLLSFICMSLRAQWTSAFVHPGKDGRLEYKPDEKGNIIPDFSGVGYYHQQRQIPLVKVVKSVTPSAGDDLAVIQQAIDEVSKMPVAANGFRGAILLKKGTYKISGTIKVGAGGIVLRGEGDETKLIATGKGQRSLISVSGSGNLKELPGTGKRITDRYVPVGAKSFMITDAKDLKQGDRIVVFRPGTQKWITDLKMDQIEVRDSGTRQWPAKEYDLHFERQITKIQGNRIFIDNPVVMAMEDQYGGGEVYQYSFNGRITEVGVEDLSFESEYASDVDEDHGWNAVSFNKVENGWVRNVQATFFGYSCVNLGSQSKNITVQHCRSIDAKSQITGGRRYSFNNDGQQNLFVDCYASDGRHDYVTGAKVLGPNVFFRSKAEKTHADIGPHHRWAVGTLYDNIETDGEINVQDRGNWGTGHGWAGANQVIWNCTVSKAAIQDPWVSGKNYVIGLKGEKYEGRLKGRPDAVWEGQNKQGLQPSSLFEIQSKEAGVKWDELYKN
ncbi:hypothetical protein LZZ85_06975 [Terrimonas sp. NA20]|uniref:Pectate lyase superfamily protein domain-containing protein n=1 Tax=Terrimonas ginsenosidimutans TaxID=2908004 RepID=A0ABS9KNV6_9BACT|nr:hypothetical protein [Terrimonas ginsenosidimutans]MCG2614016.1 hypothetical protein [Terrimonas ginsenosidimutans]